MTRNTIFTLVAIAASMTTACGGGTTDPDAGGTDAGATDAGRDAGGQMPDAGTDAGPPPPSCTTGCAIVELALGSEHTCGRRENGEVLCWGLDRNGQLGDGAMGRLPQCGGTGTDPRPCSGVGVPVRLNTVPAALTDAVAISTQGASTTCALRENGEVWCWGLRLRVGMKSTDDAIAQRLGDLTAVHAVSEGSLHRCLIQGTDRIAICGGFNGAGQLGIGDLMELDTPAVARPVLDPTGTDPITGFEEVGVSGWGENSCGRTADAVYCWGSNVDGQLGDNAPPYDRCVSGGFPSSCSNLARAVPLPEVAQLAVGRGHVCALRSGSLAGRVDCWGDNRARQLGEASNDSLPDPTEVAGLTDVAQIAAGAHFTCARRMDGTVWCWGANVYGQVGDGVVRHATCIVGEDSVDCVASPAQVVGIDDATYLATGSSHACVIRASGQVWCWGHDSAKQLGDDSTNDAFAPVQVTAIPE